MTLTATLYTVRRYASVDLEVRIGKLISFLDSLSQRALVTLILAILIILGAVDFLTGYEISFAVFYLLPVMLAALGLGQLSGIWVSLLSASIWMLVNWLAGERFSYTAIHVWNAGTRALFFLAVAYLLAELRALLAAEVLLARTDVLTGLLNRRAVLQDIAKLLPIGQPYALLNFDLDHFKEVNDFHGHAAGDRVLQAVGQVLREQLPPGGLAARMGGDEFAVLVWDWSEVRAEQWVMDLRRCLLARMRQNGWPVTFSMGLVTGSGLASNLLPDLLQLADEGMYQAKNAGKNRVVHLAFPMPGHSEDAAPTINGTTPSELAVNVLSGRPAA